MLAGLGGLLRACLAGAAAVTAVVGLGSLPFTLMTDESVMMTLVGLVTLLPIVAIVALAMILGAALLAGVPLTILLARRGRESRRAYVFAGGGTGIVLAPLVSYRFGNEEPLALLIPLVLGLVGGTTTGWAWWRHRRTVIARRGVTAPKR